MVQALGDAAEHIRQPLLTGSVRLGIAEDFTGSALPGILGRFKRMHPGVRLTVETGLSGSLSDRLKDGDFDLVLSKRADPRQGARIISTEPLVWVVAASPKHLLEEHPLPLVLHPRPSVTAEAVFAALRTAGIEHYVALSSPSISGLRAGVLAGLGISAFGRRFVPPGLRELRADESTLPSLPDLEYGLEKRVGALPAAVSALADLILPEVDAPSYPDLA